VRVGPVAVVLGSTARPKVVMELRLWSRVTHADVKSVCLVFNSISIASSKRIIDVATAQRDSDRSAEHFSTTSTSAFGRLKSAAIGSHAHEKIIVRCSIHIRGARSLNIAKNFVRLGRGIKLTTSIVLDRADVRLPDNAPVCLHLFRVVHS